jgi:hypothetical protein
MMIKFVVSCIVHHNDEGKQDDNNNDNCNRFSVQHFMEREATMGIVLVRKGRSCCCRGSFGSYYSF